jgi:oligopeptide transport system substrate-binding protein
MVDSTKADHHPRARWPRSVFARTVLVVGVICLCLLPALTLASGKATPTKTSGSSKAQAAKDHATKAAAITATATAAGPRLRMNMPDVSPQIDPALVADEENVQLADLLYTGLVRLDAHYHVQPAAAQSIDISKDHLLYTFHLRHGLRFSNGDPITAEDFAFSITRSLSPSIRSPSAAYYLLDIAGASAVLEGKAKTVSGLQVVDPYTLRITARWPIKYFLMELTFPTSFALDEKRILKLGPAVNTRWYAHPISSGPYQLKSLTQNQKMVLVANKYYLGPQPLVPQIQIALTPLPATNLYAYVVQHLDITSLPAYDPTMLGNPGVHSTNALAIDGLYMNLTAKPFDNVKVRKAFAMSLDRNLLTGKVLGKTVTPFYGFVPPNEPGYDANIKGPSYNPAAARALLKSAGYTTTKSKTDFPKVTLSYVKDPALDRLVTWIAASWRKNLGITITTNALESSAFFTDVQSGSLPLYFYGWSADYPDPHDWLTLLWRSSAVNNNVHYHNPQFDKLVASADVTWRVKRRMNLYDQAQELLVQDEAWIPLYIPHRVVYVRPGVTNINVTGFGIIPQAGTWSRVQVHTNSQPARQGQ